MNRTKVGIDYLVEKASYEKVSADDTFHNATKYKYLNYNESEQSKGTARIKNPDYPQNYFDELERIKDLYDYTLF